MVYNEGHHSTSTEGAVGYVYEGGQGRHSKTNFHALFYGLHAQVRSETDNTHRLTNSKSFMIFSSLLKSSSECETDKLTASNEEFE